MADTVITVGDVTFMMREFVPLLRKVRVDDEDIDRFLTENPRRFFGGDCG